MFHLTDLMHSTLLKVHTHSWEYRNTGIPTCAEQHGKQWRRGGVYSWLQRKMAPQVTLGGDDGERMCPKRLGPAQRPAGISYYLPQVQ